MNLAQIVYNASILVGIGLVTAGTWIEFGAGFGLIIAGAAVLVFTVYAAERLAPRPR